MDKPDAKKSTSDLDSGRRKLLKIGIYTVPIVLLMGKVSGAHGSPKRRYDRHKWGDYWHKRR